jgi:hypothetical protein
MTKHIIIEREIDYPVGHSAGFQRNHSMNRRQACHLIHDYLLVPVPVRLVLCAVHTKACVLNRTARSRAPRWRISLMCLTPHAKRSCAPVLVPPPPLHGEACSGAARR